MSTTTRSTLREAFKVALAASETAVVGWNRDSKGKYRYVQADGTYAVNKWLLINHHWYLFGKDGYMLTGWQRWNGSSVIGLDEPGDWYFSTIRWAGRWRGHAGMKE